MEIRKCVNKRAEKATCKQKRDWNSTQGGFPSSLYLIRDAGREYVVVARAYVRTLSCTYVRGLMPGAALINMHSRRNIYRRWLLLARCASRGARRSDRVSRS